MSKFFQLYREIKGGGVGWSGGGGGGEGGGLSHYSILETAHVHQVGSSKTLY